MFRNRHEAQTELIAISGDSVVGRLGAGIALIEGDLGVMFSLCMVGVLVEFSDGQYVFMKVTYHAGIVSPLVIEAANVFFDGLLTDATAYSAR
jgi:hypothetical protein